MMFHKILIALAMTAGLSGSAAIAQDDVLLTVTGPDGATLAQYTMTDLEGFDPVTFETETIWTDGVHSYTGVSLDALLDSLGVDVGDLSAQAINDYAVIIPVADAVAGGPIIAYLSDGEPMSIRDKGPLWIIYPFDSVSGYQTETIYSRSIWQLDRIHVVE